jgi:hypothetical protein
MWLSTADLAVFHVGTFSRGNLTSALISAAYVVVGTLLIVYSYTENVAELRSVAIGVFVLGGLVAWLASHKRFRLIADTPTALVRSAPQGYVELRGSCQPIPDAGLLHYGKTPPCLWYFAIITEHERRWSRNRIHTRTERSDDTFLLVDETGECVIDPDGAEVLSANKTTWREGDIYYKVYYVIPGERLYALGDLRTVRAADATLDKRGDLNALLREWKQDKHRLLARFDTDGDGEIDMQEWQAAVTAAGRQVDGQHREMRLAPGYHVMSEPSGGRPYLLSNRDPEALTRRYKWWAWFHLAVFLAATVAALRTWLTPIL